MQNVNFFRRVGVVLPDLPGFYKPGTGPPNFLKTREGYS